MNRTLLYFFISCLLIGGAFFSSSVQAQGSCTPVTLAQWDMPTCIAFAGSGDYSEFTPTYPNNGDCGSVTASTVYRNQGRHSCNPGRPGGAGLGFCVGSLDSPGYIANSPLATRLTVSFGAGDRGQLTRINFWELSTNPIYQNHTPQGFNNNYPTRYGIRVMKNGNEIFRQTNIPTTQVWSLETFDFSSNTSFAYNGATTFEFEIFAYAPVGNGFNNHIWDLDDFSVEGCCITCDNVTAPGVIAGAENNCGGYDPALITSTSLPSGGSGALEYIWLQNSTSSNTGATIIPGANGPSYDPGPITQTTCYRRCARRAGCTTYAGESNWICKTVDPAPVINLNGTNVDCNGNASGSVTASASGGTAPYTYAWSNGGTAASISNLAAGSYSVTVTDANGCSSNQSTTITEPTALGINPQGTDVICNGNGDGTASANPSGGRPPYSFAWSNGGTSATITNLLPGTYSVTLTDANSCTENGSVTISEPLALTLSLASTDASCFNYTDGTVTSTSGGGTPPYSYNWSNGGSTANLSAVGAGSYSLTVTDANGCAISASSTVQEPSLLEAGLSGTDISCFGADDGTAVSSPIGGTPPYSFSWSNGATSQGISSLSPGNYDVTVTDANGCTAQSQITINEPTLLQVSLTGTDASCNGGNDGSLSATASGGTPAYTYLWSNGATTASTTNLSAGSYSVTVTDANGCTATASANVNQPSPLVVALQATNPSCNGGNDGSATANGLGGTAPYTYAWSNGGTTQTISNLAAGNYTVTATDANGCSASSSINLIPTSPLNVVATATNISCNGANDGSANASVTGGTGPYGYAWSNGANTPMVSGLAAGNYALTVTDANGCTGTAFISIFEPSALNVSATGSSVSCAGDKTGTVSSSASGGTPPYSYAWSNGNINASANQLFAGTYTITVTDSRGCTATATAIVTEPAPIVVNITATDASCGQNDGTAFATASGGVGPYFYSWSNNQTGAFLQNLPGGNYTVFALDFNGCIGTGSTTINAIGLPGASICCSDTAICSGTSADIQVDFTGTGPWTFTYTDGTSNFSVTTNNNPYILQVSPTALTTYTLASVSNVCGNGDACGTATVAVNNCNLPSNDPCATNCFNTDVLSVTDSANCEIVTLQISCDGNCPRALSNVTINLPNGTFGGGSTSAGFPVIATAPGGDPNSGLNGIKIDNINNFCNNNSVDSFTVTFVVCYDSNDCCDNFCLPLVAYKAGQCVIYDQTTNGGNVPLAPAIGSWPNPFGDKLTIEADIPEQSEVSIEVYDLMGQQQIHAWTPGTIPAGKHIYVWDGTDTGGQPVANGMYIIRLNTNHGSKTTKVILSR